MDLASFKKLYKKYLNQPLTNEVWQTPEYESYIEAIDSSKTCGDWYLKQKIKDAGINYKRYCCTHMAYYLIEDKKSKKNPEVNYDSIVTQRKADFGIPIHDGGNSYIKIEYCPWCGKEL
jgi:hypothetical protein